MVKKIFIPLILVLNLFVFNSGCPALDLNDNNLFIPSISPNINDSNVQEIINKTLQLEAKCENERNSLKSLAEQKKADYLEAKKNFKTADKQLKAVRSVTKKLQKNF